MPHLEAGGRGASERGGQGRAKRATSSRNFNIDRSKMPIQRPRGRTIARRARAPPPREPRGVPKRARSRTIRTSCPRRTKHSSCGSRSRLFVGGGSGGIRMDEGGRVSSRALFFVRIARRGARAATRRDARSRRDRARGARIDGRTSARAHLERRRRRARGPRARRGIAAW